MASLEDKYATLRNLFPGWTGRDGHVPGQMNSGMVATNSATTIQT